MTQTEIDAVVDLLVHATDGAEELERERLGRLLLERGITHPAPKGTECPVCGEKEAVWRICYDDGWWNDCETCGTDWKAT